MARRLSDGMSLPEPAAIYDLWTISEQLSVELEIEMIQMNDTQWDINKWWPSGLFGSAVCWLTHWGRGTHICVGKLTIIGSENGLSPGRRQAIIRNNDGILIGPLVTKFSGILIGTKIFPFKRIHVNVSSWKWRLFCLGLNVLTGTKSISIWLM